MMSQRESRFRTKTCWPGKEGKLTAKEGDIFITAPVLTRKQFYSMRSSDSDGEEKRGG